MTELSVRAVRLAALMLLAIAAVLSTLSSKVRAQSPAEAAQPPLTITLLTSTRADLCHDNGYAAAVSTLARRELDRINRLGGIGGRRLDIKLLDDGADGQRTIGDLRSALADPNAIAIVGLSSSNRAKPAFEALAREIGVHFQGFVTFDSSSGE